MTTEMITLKLGRQFLREVNRVVKNSSYHNRTEFIRNALREKIDEIKLKEAMMEIAALKGASKKKTTDAEYERVRELAFRELDKKLK